MRAVFRQSCSWAIAPLMALGVSAGCAGSRVNLKREHRLEQENAELRAQARKQRRAIRDLENENVLLRERLARAEEGALELPVERLERERAAVEPPPEPVEIGAAGLADDGVEILYVGEAARDEAVRPKIADSGGYGIESGKSRERPTPSRTVREVPPVPTVPVGSDTDLGVTEKVPTIDTQLRAARSGRARSRTRTFDDPRAEYRLYYEALRAGNHAKAVAGFRNFVERFPGHSLADNAQYWLAEAYYDQKRYKTALVEFRAVTERFSKGNKVPDAMLKIGYCHIHLGELDEARAALARVSKIFPNTSPGKLAAAKLQQMD